MSALISSNCLADDSTTESRTHITASDQDAVQEPLDTSMSAPRSLPLLICSIGNPGSTYANTLHSAGHTAIQRLADRLGFGPFKKEREFGGGLVSTGFGPTGSPWTLWQSTSYMNVSGPGVNSAWRAWSRSIPDGQGKLVVVHDELQKSPGTITLKTTQGLSAGGHNGLKSIKSVIGNTPFVRIGVGIGRPVSRDSNDVAQYVLKKMTPAEKEHIFNAVDDIIVKLEEVARS